MHIVLLLAMLASGDTLTGRVTDQSGQPVAIATVEIAELGMRVTTTADGAFGFNIPGGRYTLTVTHAGFAPASRAIAVHGTTTLDVRLAVSPFALEPVTITATRSRSLSISRRYRLRHSVAQACVASRECRSPTFSRRFQACAR